MVNKVTVGLHDVIWERTAAQGFKHVIDQYEKLPLDKRWRGEDRLDHVEHVQVTSASGTFPGLVLHFAKLRNVGPGKLSKATAYTPIELDEGSFFGEETSALYLPKKKWLLVLKNRYGIGSARMATYFNNFEVSNKNGTAKFEVRPYLDADAINRFLHWNGYKTLEIVATVGAFSELEKTSGLKEGISEVASQYKAKVVHLTLSGREFRGRVGQLENDATQDLVNNALGLDDVFQLKAASADNADDVINLIEHKVHKTWPATQLEIADGCYTRASKSALLRRTCEYWLESLG